jgi:hypothetical protein
MGPRAILMLLLGGGVLTVVCLRRRRALGREGARGTTSYHFYEYSLEFLLPFVVVTGAYLVAYLVLASRSDAIEFGSLLAVQSVLHDIAAAARRLYLTPTALLVVLMLLYVLSLVRLFGRHTATLFAVLDHYQKWTRRAYIMAVVLTSFTFFGANTGTLRNELTLRISAVREGYTQLEHTARDVLSAAIADRLSATVTHQLHTQWPDAMQLPDRVGAEAEELRALYAEGQATYGVVSAAAEGLLRAHDQRRQAGVAFEKLPMTAPASRTSLGGGAAARAVPDRGVTHRQVAKGAAAVDESLQQTRAKPSAQPQGDGQHPQAEALQRVLRQLPKVLTDKAKMALLQPLLRSNPLLEPIVGVLVRTLDKEVERRTEPAVARIVRASLEAPASVGTVVASEATALLSGKDLTLPEPAMRHARDAMVRERGAITEAKTQLTRDIAHMRNERQLAKLAEADRGAFGRLLREVDAVAEQLTPAQRARRHALHAARVAALLRDLRTGQGEVYRDASQSLGEIEGSLTAAQKREVEGLRARKMGSLIAKLSSQQRLAREAAVTELVALGEDLGPREVERLLGVMQHGDKRWSEFLRREEGRHCSWYEETTDRYYAARVLGAVKSPHVPEQARQEARRIERSGRTERRVMYPGWV